MSSNDDVQPSANTSIEEMSVNTAFKDLEKAIEMIFPYKGATLPVTPARTPDSGSIMSLPANEETVRDNSPTEQRKEVLRSDSMRNLWHRTEDQSARARLQSREARAGWFSRLTFHWASNLLWVGPTPWLIKPYSASSDDLLLASILDRLSATISCKRHTAHSTRSPISRSCNGSTGCI